jgi:Na+-driven multidrug efflux pump
MAARTKLLLEGPILPILLRLSAPNVLNLLAIAGMITFDGLFVGRLSILPSTFLTSLGLIAPAATLTTAVV